MRMELDPEDWRRAHVVPACKNGWVGGKRLAHLQFLRCSTVSGEMLGQTIAQPVYHASDRPCRKQNSIKGSQKWNGTQMRGNWDIRVMQGGRVTVTEVSAGPTLGNMSCNAEFWMVNLTEEAEKRWLQAQGCFSAVWTDSMWKNDQHRLLSASLTLWVSPLPTCQEPSTNFAVS